MAIEDFSTYTEVDPNSKIAVATRRVTFTSLRSNEDAYVYYDFGANYFDEDLVAEFEIWVTGTPTNGSLVPYFSLANLVDDAYGIVTANGDALWIEVRQVASLPYLRLGVIEVNAGSLVRSTEYGLTSDTSYYLKVVRDESYGTYGRLYCYVYSDAARTTLLSTLTLNLTAKTDFRYLYAIQSFNYTHTYAMSGWIEDLEISTTLTLATVTTLPLTDIVTTTATGNGVIDNLGLSSVTEHGHCWATSIDPTTADSKTTNGAGSLGAFTSSITGLIEGQRYYVRAYATNTQGTAYGANVTFIAGRSSTQLVGGEIKVVQERLHYVGFDGKERYIEGNLV